MMDAAQNVTPNQKQSKPSNCIYILKIFAVFCCLIAVSGVNLPHISPFSTQLSVLSPTSFAVSEHGSVILDREQSRLLILSPDGKLRHIVDATKSGSPIDIIIDTTIYEDHIYCIGAKSFYQGAYYSEEDIVVYDFQGKLKKTLPLKTYQESDYVNEYSFDSIRVNKDGIFAVGRENNTVFLYKYAENNSQPLFRAELPEIPYFSDFGPADDTIYGIGMSQTCYQINLHTGKVNQTNTAAMVDSYRTYFGIEPEMIFSNDAPYYNMDTAVVYSSSGKASHASVTELDSGEYFRFADGHCNHGILDKVDCTVSFLLANGFFWFSAAVTIAGAACLILYLIVKKLAHRGRIILLIVGGILLTSVFYTYQSNHETENTYAQFLTTQTKQLSLSISHSYGDTFQKIISQGAYEYCTDVKNQPAIEKLNHLLREMCNSNGNQKTSQYHCVLFDEECMYFIADSAHYYPSGYAMPYSDRITENSQHTLITLPNDSFATILFDYEYLHASDGSIVGMFVAASKQRNMFDVQMNNSINYFVSLSSLIIGIFIVFSMCSAISTALRNFKAEKPQNTDQRIVHMSVIFSILSNMLYYLDSVIVVYVIRNLCTGMNSIEIAVKAALPISLCKVGELLGKIAYVPLCKKIGERTTAVMVCICTILSLLGCAAAVIMNNYALFTIAQFFMGLFLKGLLDLVCGFLPFHEKDEKKQGSVLDRCTNYSIAATILTMLLGGYVSEFLSYAMIYLIGAVIAVLMLILCVLVLRNEWDLSEDNAESMGWKSWAVFLKGPVLMSIIFHSIPLALLTGYSSYFFPLYSAEVGLSALLLSNLNVFAKTLSYLVADTLRKLSKKMDPGSSAAVPLLLSSLGLVYFYFCPNIYWAIFMLLVTVTIPILDRELVLMNMNIQCKYYRTNRKEYKANLFSVDSVMAILTPSALSTTVGLGMDLACSAVGLVCGVMLSIYGFFNRCFVDKAMKKAELGKS